MTVTLVQWRDRESVQMTGLSAGWKATAWVKPGPVPGSLERCAVAMARSAEESEARGEPVQVLPLPAGDFDYDRFTVDP